MSSSRTDRVLSTAGMAIAAVLGIIGVLIAIGAHPADSGLTPPPASEAESARQDVAVTAARIEASASESGDKALAARARDWQRAAGGVWVPWPSGAPSGYTNPPKPTGPAPAKIGEDLAALRDQAVRAADAAGAAEEKQAFRAIALAASLRLTKGAEAQPVASPGAVPVVVPCGKPNAEAVVKGLDAAAVKRLDTSLQWLEASVARGESEAEKSVPRNSALGSLVESALSGQHDDPRAPFAPLPSERPITKAAFAELYSSLLSSSAPSGDSVALACTLTLTDAERDQAPALPGLTAAEVRESPASSSAR